MSISSRVAAALGLVALCACGGSQPAEQPPAQSAPAATAPAASGAVQVAAGDFGVPECDQYLRKYFACVDSKVPDAAKPMLKQSVEQMKEAWKKAAATPQGKAGLAQACTQAEAQAKVSMAAYGCTW